MRGSRSERAVIGGVADRKRLARPARLALLLPPKVDAVFQVPIRFRRNGMRFSQVMSCFSAIKPGTILQGSSLQSTLHFDQAKFVINYILRFTVNLHFRECDSKAGMTLPHYIPPSIFDHESCPAFLRTFACSVHSMGRATDALYPSVQAY